MSDIERADETTLILFSVKRNDLRHAFSFLQIGKPIESLKLTVSTDKLVLESCFDDLSVSAEVGTRRTEGMTSETATRLEVDGKLFENILCDRELGKLESSCPPDPTVKREDRGVPYDFRDITFTFRGPEKNVDSLIELSVKSPPDLRINWWAKNIASLDTDNKDNLSEAGDTGQPFEKKVLRADVLRELLILVGPVGRKTAETAADCIRVFHDPSGFNGQLSDQVWRAEVFANSKARAAAISCGGEIDISVAQAHVSPLARFLRVCGNEVEFVESESKYAFGKEGARLEIARGRTPTSFSGLLDEVAADVALLDQYAFSDLVQKIVSQTERHRGNVSVVLNGKTDGEFHLIIASNGEKAEVTAPVQRRALSEQELTDHRVTIQAEELSLVPLSRDFSKIEIQFLKRAMKFVARGDGRVVQTYIKSTAPILTQA